MSTKQEKILSRRVLIALMIAGISVATVFTVAPWNFIPTIVTEDVTVLAVIEQGCVGESVYGISVVVPECNAKVGDIVSATFYVPSSKLNSYYDRIQEKVDMIQP